MSEADHREQLTIRLGSEQNEANAEAVSSTMSAILALVLEANQEINKNELLLIKARPFAKGSFEIPLDLIIVAGGAIFDCHPLINNILDSIKNYFEIKNLLKGNRVEKKNDTTIIVEGDEFNIGSVTINMLSHQCLANQKMAEALELVEKDDTISDIELIRNQDSKPLAKVTRPQFGYYKVDVSSAETEKVMRETQAHETMSIASIVFEGDAKWRFNRSGNIISAAINDKDFLTRVQHGNETFAAGDRLEVDLVINQEYDHLTSDYKNKSYMIERVLKHEKPEEQQTFFD